MFDWIPLQYYTTIHYHLLLLIALVILFHSFNFKIDDSESIQFFNITGYIIVFLLIFYMGLRPISGRYFGDTANYAVIYSKLQQGEQISVERDYMFNYFMKFCSRIMGVHSFYLLLDFLYVLPFLFFSRKYFGTYWFFAMFAFIGSFLFWGAGTNGLRNGLGTSFFIVALCFYDKKIWMYMLFALSYFMHASLIIPLFAFLVLTLYKNPKAYIYFWIACIPLSLVGGSLWINFFGSIGYEDRTAGYLTNAEENLSQFSRTGFRWDFLLYSASAVFAGWYFIFKKKITDPLYVHLFGVYCISNAFWILVITAAFSNRFAYLSWFLMPAVIAYPMFRYKIWKDQYRIFGIIIFLYFMFTYFMNVIK